MSRDSPMKYDEMLTQILVNEHSILGFLSTIFNFLARRTDFYYVSQGPHDNMGFPPGVAEELVVKVLRSCDPKNWRPPNGANKPADINNEIMCSTVAQEVEVVADEVIEETPEQRTDIVYSNIVAPEQSSSTNPISSGSFEVPESTGVPNQTVPVKQPPSVPEASLNEPPQPPMLPTQRNSETYNGAETEHYCWAQTIMDLDVTVKLPTHIKSAKHIKVTINPAEICVACLNGEIIVKDTLQYKCKAVESFWTISGGKLLIHLEKSQERWWTKLFVSEKDIELNKIDCSRPLDELPADHIDKIRELQWNQEQKMKGLPTSDQLRNMEILKKAWNAAGSPFKGKEFDPSIFQHQ